MADRSPSKPRRSLTPEASDVNPPPPPLPPPPHASGSSSRDEADDIIDDSDAETEADAGDVAIAACKTSDALEGRTPRKSQVQQQQQQQQQQQVRQQQPSPGSAQHSPGGTSSSPAAEDAVVDRSPSKPKRVTSPVPNQPQPPYFRRTGSLRFSLREDPEPTTGPSSIAAAGAPSSSGTRSPPFPISVQQQQLSSSLPYTHSSSGASSLLPPPPPPPQQPLHCTTYAQWHGSLSSSLHHRHPHQDDESTQTWNESTQTFATSSAWFESFGARSALGEATVTHAGAAEGGGSGSPPQDEDLEDWREREGLRRYRERGDPPDHHDVHHHDDDNSHADDGSDADVVPSGEGTGVAEAPAESSAPNSSGTTPEKSNSSPGSSQDRSPTSASMSLASLTGAPHPAPASTTSIAERRQRPRRGDAGMEEAIGASASVASASTTSVSTAFRPVLTMEVAPGVSRPLWHSDVTRTAVTHGRARECVCAGCRTALYYVPRAAYVLCPVCSTVGPLLAPLPPQPAGATEAAAPGGGARKAEERPDASAICVGVKRDDPPSSPSRA